MILNELSTNVLALLLRLIAGVFALLMALFFNLWIVDANGIGTVLKDEVVGPYHVRVGVTPFPAQTGRTIMSISLEDTEGFKEPISPTSASS